MNFLSKRLLTTLLIFSIGAINNKCIAVDAMCKCKDMNTLRETNDKLLCTTKIPLNYTKQYNDNKINNKDNVKFPESEKQELSNIKDKSKDINKVYNQQLTTIKNHVNYLLTNKRANIKHVNKNAINKFLDIIKWWNQHKKHYVLEIYHQIVEHQLKDKQVKENSITNEIIKDKIINNEIIMTEST